MIVVCSRCFIEEKQMRNRNIDILKGIGIILVVLSHAECPFGGWYGAWFVQLFFIAAGYTYNSSKIYTRGGVKNYIIKRIKRLFLPWVIVGIIFTFFNNTFIKMNILTNDIRFLDAVDGNSYGLDKVYSLTDIFQKITKIIFFQSAPKISGAMWFLAVLFFTDIGYSIIDYICKRFIKMYYAAVINVIMLLIYIVGVYVTVNNIVDNSGYRLNIVLLSIFLFHIGQKIKIYELQYKEFNPIFTIFMALFVIYIFKILKVESVRYVRGEIGGGVQFFLWSMSGWSLVYGVSQIIAEGESFIANVLIYIGKHTLPIVILHQISFKIVTCIQIKIYVEPEYMLAAFPVLHSENGWWLIYCIIGICVPLFLYEMGNKGLFFIRKIISLL